MTTLTAAAALAAHTAELIVKFGQSSGTTGSVQSMSMGTALSKIQSYHKREQVSMKFRAEYGFYLNIKK